MPEVSDGTQLMLFKTGEPKRWRPSEDELADAIQRGVRMAVWKRHRGRPPRGMTFDDLYSEVTVRTLARVKNFRHGGSKTLFEYTYVAACYSLTDLQRENMRSRSEEAPKPLPLFEGDFE